MSHRTERPVMLRAGGETRGVPAFTSPIASPVTLCADISEFQPEIADALYLSWSRAVIIRAAYGDAHDDRAWYGGQRRALLHEGGVAFLGIYQFLVAGQDAAAQARAFTRIVGKLEPGEMPVCDLEEGEGDQSGRWDTWKAVIEDAWGFTPWLYSSLFFASGHGLRPQWVAAYQANEPVVPHILWQFSSSYPVPGVGLADCSVFRGTIGELASCAYQGASWTEELMQELPALAQGATGEDVRTVQGLLCARGITTRIDGDYGPLTRASVEAFQRRAGFTGADVDGVAGKMTWPRLLNR